MHGSVRANVEIETRSRMDVSEARNDIADNNECGTRGVHDTKVLSRTGEVSCMKRISGLRTAAAGVGSKIVIQGPGYYLYVVGSSRKKLSQFGCSGTLGQDI